LSLIVYNIYCLFSKRLMYFFISAISFSCALIISCASSFTWGSLILALLLVSTAMEWCGIIAFIYVTSPMGFWLRTKSRALIKRTRIPSKINLFLVLFLYILCIIAHIITAIAEMPKQVI